jgi:hypothetical protein
MKLNKFYDSSIQTARGHQVYLFVADEIYASKEYLQRIDGIYPASELNLNLLKRLSKK